MLDNIRQAVGKTPLVAVDRIAAGFPARVAVKLEFYSPGGSIKDRPALAIIEAAERDGTLKKGQVVIEKTSGNMGGGLAWVCAVKGYKFIAVMSAGNTPERRQMIRAFGGRVEVVPQAKGAKKDQVSREDLDLVEIRTAQLVKKYKAYRPDQFNNPNSVAAHERGTGPEIWEQTGGKVTHFISYAGSSGTLIGTAKALKARNRDIQCYVAEPLSAQFFAGKKIRSTSHVIQGGGYATMPGFYDASVVDGSIPVSDAEALKMARLLAAKEGIMAGFSSGANLAAALKIAKKAKPGSLVVTVCCDTGLKYLSTELYRE